MCAPPHPSLLLKSYEKASVVISLVSYLNPNTFKVQKKMDTKEYYEFGSSTTKINMELETSGHKKKAIYSVQWIS